MNRLPADIRTLGLAAGTLPWGSDGQIDADNAFCEFAMHCMTEAQLESYERWCMKATVRERIEEALRLLGQPPLVWPPGEQPDADDLDPPA